MAKTLTQLRLLAQQRADLENSSHISDSEWTSLINFAIEELYDIIVNTNEDYFLDTYTFTTSGVASYDLPNDFYKLISVNAKIFNNDYKGISKYTHSQRNRSSISTNNFRYRLKADQIEFVPTPQNNIDCLLEYIPNPVVLEDEGDEWSLEQFNEYIITHAAIAALNKEESDTKQLERRLVKLEANVKSFVYRDDSEPDAISDIWNNSWDDGFFN